MAILDLNSDNFEETITNGITLVDFYADWCGPCKMIKPFIDQIAQETDVKIGQVNIDHAADLVDTYSVMSVPTLIVFKDGELIDQKIGFMTKEQILTLIDQAR